MSTEIDTYIKRDRPTDKVDTKRETDRQIDRQKDKQIRHTERES